MGFQQTAAVVARLLMGSRAQRLGGSRAPLVEGRGWSLRDKEKPGLCPLCQNRAQAPPGTTLPRCRAPKGGRGSLFLVEGCPCSGPRKLLVDRGPTGTQGGCGRGCAPKTLPGVSGDARACAGCGRGRLWRQLSSALGERRLSALHSAPSEGFPGPKAHVRPEW